MGIPYYNVKVARGLRNEQTVIEKVNNNRAYKTLTLVRTTAKKIE